ncbi:hypothetical protein JTB14_030173 [Gonioctena quinquepunctata]|nr:hypothetical protein JTB14_030173 [Gonioctena quinquepunctata]
MDTEKETSNNSPVTENIYLDVIDFDLGTEVEKLKEENKLLEDHIDSLEGDVEKLTDALQRLKVIQENLARNISSLFLTAKAELARKDRIIDELRNQLDDVLFRRKRKDWNDPPMPFPKRGRHEESYGTKKIDDNHENEPNLNHRTITGGQCKEGSGERLGAKGNSVNGSEGGDYGLEGSDEIQGSNSVNGQEEDYHREGAAERNRSDLNHSREHGKDYHREESGERNGSDYNRSRDHGKSRENHGNDHYNDLNLIDSKIMDDHRYSNHNRNYHNGRDYRSKNDDVDKNRYSKRRRSKSINSTEKYGYSKDIRSKIGDSEGNRYSLDNRSKSRDRIKRYDRYHENGRISKRIDKSTRNSNFKTEDKLSAGDEENIINVTMTSQETEETKLATESQREYTKESPRELKKTKKKLKALLKMEEKLLKISQSSHSSMEDLIQREADSTVNKSGNFFIDNMDNIIHSVMLDLTKAKQMLVIGKEIHSGNRSQADTNREISKASADPVYLRKEQVETQLDKQSEISISRSIALERTKEPEKKSMGERMEIYSEGRSKNKHILGNELIPRQITKDLVGNTIYPNENIEYGMKKINEESVDEQNSRHKNSDVEDSRKKTDVLRESSDYSRVTKKCEGDEKESGEVTESEEEVTESCKTGMCSKNDETKEVNDGFLSKDKENNSPYKRRQKPKPTPKIPKLDPKYKIPKVDQETLGKNEANEKNGNDAEAQRNIVLKSFEDHKSSYEGRSRDPDRKNERFKKKRTKSVPRSFFGRREMGRDQRSRSKSKGRRTWSISKQSQAQSREGRNRSRSRERETRSKSREGGNRSKSSERQTRSKSSQRQSQGESKEGQNRCKSRQGQARDKSQEGRTRSESRERKTRSKSRDGHSAKSREELTQSKSKERCTISDYYGREPKTATFNRQRNVSEPGSGIENSRSRSKSFSGEHHYKQHGEDIHIFSKGYNVCKPRNNDSDERESSHQGNMVIKEVDQLQKDPRLEKKGMIQSMANVCDLIIPVYDTEVYCKKLIYSSRCEEVEELKHTSLGFLGTENEHEVHYKNRARSPETEKIAKEFQKTKDCREKIEQCSVNKNVFMKKSEINDTSLENKDHVNKSEIVGKKIKQESTSGKGDSENFDERGTTRASVDKSVENLKNTIEVFHKKGDDVNGYESIKEIQCSEQKCLELPEDRDKNEIDKNQEKSEGKYSKKRKRVLETVKSIEKSPTKYSKSSEESLSVIKSMPKIERKEVGSTKDRKKNMPDIFSAENDCMENEESIPLNDKTMEKKDKAQHSSPPTDTIEIASEKREKEAGTFATKKDVQKDELEVKQSGECSEKHRESNTTDPIPSKLAIHQEKIESSPIPNPSARKRITPIRVEKSPVCSFENILQKNRMSSFVKELSTPNASPLTLTHEGEIPLLHLDENHFNHLNDDGTQKSFDRNIMNLLDTMNISNLECDITKLEISAEKEDCIKSVNEKSPQFEGVTNEVVATADTHALSVVPSATVSTDSVVTSTPVKSSVSGHTNASVTNVQNSEVRTPLTSSAQNSSSVIRRRRRVRLVVID